MSQTSKERKLIEAANSWIQEIIFEGVWAITKTFAVLKFVKEMNKMEWNLISSLTQEANNLKEILDDWDEMIKFDLDAMVSCDILPSCEMFFIFKGLISYKEKTLMKLIKKLQVAFRDYQEVETSVIVIWKRWDAMLLMILVILWQQREWIHNIQSISMLM